MKKLLTIAIVAMMAVASQAATVAWNSGALYKAADKDGGLSSTKAKDTISYSYYLVSAADYSSLQSMDDFQRQAWASTKTAADSGTSKSTTSKANFTWDGGENSKTYYLLGVYTSGTAANGDTGSFVMTGLVSATTSGTGAAVSSTDITAGRSWSAVPEPTALVLLGLGVAAVALKRKVA